MPKGSRCATYAMASRRGQCGAVGNRMLAMTDDALAA